MEHFIFLLEKLGFEVKQGKHIAVKVPGMKRFKRLDTISEDLCRESLEAMFRYGDASLAALVNRAVSLLPARKAVFSPYQRKYYARMYRLRLAEKKRFTYKSAYLYEQIRKMHELQEEYLVVVRYDVKSYGDLFRLKLRLQQVDEELCKAQQEMYRDKEQAINEINRMIDFYNNRRPHMSIGMECPMEVYKGKLPGKNLWRKRP